MSDPKNQDKETEPETKPNERELEAQTSPEYPPKPQLIPDTTPPGDEGPEGLKGQEPKQEPAAPPPKSALARPTPRCCEAPGHPGSVHEYSHGVTWSSVWHECKWPIIGGLVALAAVGAWIYSSRSSEPAAAPASAAPAAPKA